MFVAPSRTPVVFCLKVKKTNPCMLPEQAVTTNITVLMGQGAQEADGDISFSEQLLLDVTCRGNSWLTHLCYHAGAGKAGTYSAASSTLCLLTVPVQAIHLFSLPHLSQCDFS